MHEKSSSGLNPRLAGYRQRPLPENTAEMMMKKQGYRRFAVDLDGAFQAERCVDALSVGLAGANHYFRTDNAPYHQRIDGSIEQLYLRTTVAQKLIAINERIGEFGLQLWMFDAWRPVAVQNYFHDVWMPNFLKQQDPALNGEELWRRVEMYWAKGAPNGLIDPRSPPPHATGGAVDLTICNRSGEHLFMGTIFDDVTQSAHTSYFETASSDLSFSNREARANRRLLYWIMQEEGFCNNPTEWWHYSWGDQMWAKLTDQAAAVYGAVDPSSS